MTMVARAQVAVLVLTEHVGPLSFAEDLARTPTCRPVGRATSVEAAVQAAAERRPDVVIADVTTTERLHAVVSVAGELAGARLVVVSALPVEVGLLPSLAGGARGFLRKPLEPGAIGRAITLVAAGHTYVDPPCTQWLVEVALHGHRTRPATGLTFRQLQVVELARGGLSNRQIARALGLSMETVKSHLHGAMRRLGVHDRQAAAVLAERLREERE